MSSLPKRVAVTARANNYGMRGQVSGARIGRASVWTTFVTLDDIDALMLDLEMTRQQLIGRRGKSHKCPVPGCETHIDSSAKFRDETSVREYEISGMCQRCQDEVFSE